MKDKETIKRVKTSEDWFPNFDNNTVEVSLYEYHKNHGNSSHFKVCVWGNDDFGMEINDLDRQTAKKLYGKIKDYITKKDLKNMGFINA